MILDQYGNLVSYRNRRPSRHANLGGGDALANRGT
jgi:hypothetical protein